MPAGRSCGVGCAGGDISYICLVVPSVSGLCYLVDIALFDTLPKPASCRDIAIVIRSLKITGTPAAS